MHKLQIIYVLIVVKILNQEKGVWRCSNEPDNEFDRSVDYFIFWIDTREMKPAQFRYIAGPDGIEKEKGANEGVATY